jgi:hypothetical protein
MAENPKNEKKQKKKFVLKKEALMTLTDTQLERVAGGLRVMTEPGMGTPSVPPGNPLY